MRKILLSTILLLLFFTCSCTKQDTSQQSLGNTNTSQMQTEHPYTNLLGYGLDRANIMVYFYGSDLEDISHMASADISEIQKNQFSENVRVFIETNGATNWESDIDISNTSVQRFLIDQNGVTQLESNLGPIDYDIKESLEWFISSVTKDYPAERNILILWGHGSGTSFWDNITIQEIDEILSKVGVKFEMIGFDACAMANVSMLETLSKHADYMIASSTDLPITGWDYSNWISLLTEDSSIPAETYLKRIIDDYAISIQNGLDENISDQLFNLSIFDLSKTDAFINEISVIFKEIDLSNLFHQENEEKGEPIITILDYADQFKNNITTHISTLIEQMIVHSAVYNGEKSINCINVTEQDTKKFKGSVDKYEE